MADAQACGGVAPEGVFQTLQVITPKANPKARRRIHTVAFLGEVRFEPVVIHLRTGGNSPGNRTAGHIFIDALNKNWQCISNLDRV